MIIKFRGKKLEVKVRETGAFSKFSGFMFKSSKTGNLLFRFGNPSTAAIHSFFVFFPFLAIWLDNENNVADYNLVRPFTFRVTPSLPARELIELPLNEQNRSIIKLFVGEKKDLYRR